MPRHKTMRKSRKNNRTRSRKYKRTTSRHGYFPTGSIVSYQQEPYSAKMLANINTGFQSNNVFSRYDI